MIVFLLILIYMIIASASGIVLLLGAIKHAGHNVKWDFNFGWILCGIFWPVCLGPACAYITAIYWISKMGV